MNPLNSIRGRMTAGFVLAIAILLFLVCGSASQYARRSAEGRADSLLDAAANRLTAEMAALGRPMQLSELEEESQDLRYENLDFRMVDGAGRTLYKSSERAPSWPPVALEGWRTINLNMGPNRAVIGWPWRETEEYLRRQAIVLASVSIFILLIAGIGAWLVVGKTLSPIRALAQQASESSAEGLRVSLSAPSRDIEVVKLVGTLNDLLGRVSEAASARGRFYAAASHELRTPLQALSGHLELGLTRPRSHDEDRETLREAYVQTQRLVSLVRDLLTLHQFDPGAQSAGESLDLAAVCERVLDRARPSIQEKRLDLAASFAAESVIIAQPNHAEMLVRNLVENAVKYSDAGGVLSVGLYRTEGDVTLCVTNECKATDGLNVARLTEPFYRPDLSRNSETGGNGLGLAICRAIATSNGWELRLGQVGGAVQAIACFRGRVGD